MSNLTEKTVSKESIFKGHVISLDVATVELPNGSISTRELVSHPGGVAVLAVDENENAYMVTQFRSPYKKEIFEVPAGKLDPGEEHLNCGIRELKEETGLTAVKMHYMGCLLPSPGYTNEIIYLYHAEGLSKSEQHLDDDEFLDVSLVPLEKLKDMCMSGEIADAKTIALVLKTYIKLHS